jgi:hypothetical protein
MKHPIQMNEMTSGFRFLKWPVFVIATIIFLCPFQAEAQTDNGPTSINMTAVTWKSNPEIAQTLTTEKERVDVLLSAQGLQPEELSIYKAYNLMLTYIRQHIQNNIPSQDAITKGYQQVLNEAPKNQDMAHLPDQMLGTYLPGLVEMLSETPVPVAIPR